jgi:hypothetical protein
MVVTRRRAMLVVALSLIASAPAAAQGLTANGPHANEAFCKTMVAQFVNMQTYMKSNFGRETDSKAQAKYFGEQKAFNALLVKTAPASLKADMTLIDRNLKTSFEAMQHAEKGHMAAAMAPMRTREHLTAAQHANAYCGLKVTK